MIPFSGDFFSGETTGSVSAILQKEGNGKLYLQIDKLRYKLHSFHVIDKEKDYLRLELNGDVSGIFVIQDYLTVQHVYQQKLVSPGFLMRFSKPLVAGLLVGTLLLSGTLFYHFGLEPTIQIITETISDEAENYVATHIRDQFEETVTLVEDDSLQRVLDTCAKTFESLDMVSYPIAIRVVDDSVTLNAFALPHGYIYIYKPMLQFIDSEDELFGLLSHEIAHVEYRHSLKRLVRSGIIGGIMNVLFNDISALSSLLIENSAMLLELSYDRKEELEADMFSYKLAEKIGFDGKALISLFERMNKSEHPNDVVSLFSTHPSFDKRKLQFNQLPEIHKTEQILSEHEWAIIRRF